MKSKLLINLLALLFVTFQIQAQEKELSIDVSVSGLNYVLRPTNLRQLQWRPNSEQFVEVKDNNLTAHTASGEELILLTINELNSKLKTKGLSKLRRFPRIHWSDKNSFYFTKDNAQVHFLLGAKQIQGVFKLPENAQNLDYCHSTKRLAYTLENNLYAQRGEGKPNKITSDKDKNIVNGQTVARNEFGINSGTFWSPDGNFLAFYRKDESKISDYPIVNIDERVAQVEPIKYPMAGMASETVSVGVYSFRTQKTVFLKTGEPAEQYLTNLIWSPDGKYIFIAVVNREQNHMKYNQYDAATGTFVKTLFEEKNNTFVEPLHSAQFLKNSEQFIWQSKRNGYNHVYLYNTDGELVKQLTDGKFDVTKVFGFDEKEKNLFFEAAAPSPLDRHLFQVKVKRGKIKQITKTSGTHRVQMNADKSRFLDNFSNLKTPRVITLRDKKGKILNTLLTAENPLKEYKAVSVEMITLKTADGKTDLYGYTVKPPNFDPTKKYPVILYLYGGPHSQLVRNSWIGGARTWQLYMAHKGYIGITIDNRGTWNRGFEFESAIHRQVGKLETEDQMQAVKYLQSLPYVDSERIGIHGWSFGGFMTVSMMTKYPGTFKAGVAGGPVIDWKYYEIMYGERYMDMPQENPEGYEAASLLNKTDRLKDRLMIVHGAVDPVVVWQHSMRFIRECVKSETLVDYMIYPRHQHNVLGQDRVHLMRTVTRYFDDFLK